MWLMCFCIGVALVMGLAGRAYTGIGLVIVVATVPDLWRSQRDRVKPVLFWMFGGPGHRLV